MFEADCMTVSRTACKCILGGGVPLPLKNTRGREAALLVMRDLVNTLTLPPDGRGGRTPLDERDGLPVFHSKSIRLQTFGPFASRLSTRIQPILTQHCSRTIGEISNTHVCLYKEHQE